VATSRNLRFLNHGNFQIAVFDVEGQRRRDILMMMVVTHAIMRPNRGIRRGGAETAGEFDDDDCDTCHNVAPQGY
jgi:hypothetical protein